MANAICVMIGQVNAFGVVFFKMEVTECVLVKGEFTGLPPGKHGLHIHSFGDLTNGWISAGPYYNPDDETHGAEEENKKHAGDLGTLEVNEDGLAKLDLTVQHFHLTGIHSIIGRSLVANGQVLIKGTFTGLTRGKHGLHVCTFGNLFNGYHSIGPHFNPRKKLHGGQQDNERFRQKKMIWERVQMKRALLQGTLQQV
ncbi:superoxide dismutase [Cu-Zn]-like isoform X2 [Scyliorhinus torazame]|uniref:superoxide dismutase [Cu-Zn]-like isoform X2 n=1 Tax=Scyliorhinus torazame TaxID=75743 RepID=UPI003B5C5A39